VPSTPTAKISVGVGLLLPGVVGEKLDQHSALVERALLIFNFTPIFCSVNYW
jgi:hypothetical protein